MLGYRAAAFLEPWSGPSRLGASPKTVQILFFTCSTRADRRERRAHVESMLSVVFKTQVIVNRDSCPVYILRTLIPLKHGQLYFALQQAGRELWLDPEAGEARTEA